MKQTIVFAAFLLWGTISLLLITNTHAGEIEIIAHSSVPEQTIDKSKIKEIFLGNIPKWRNNEMITIVIAEKIPVHLDFLSQYIKRTDNQFANVWRQNLFTGKGKQPYKVKSAEDIIDFISKTPWAVGYAYSGVILPETVKVISQ